MHPEQFNYLIDLSYKGTNYSGWQKQSNTKNTIQEVLEVNLKQILEHQKLTLHPASRTDAGVHALQQLVTLDLSKDYDSLKLTNKLNGQLPQDIRIKQIDRCHHHFNIHQSIATKEYRYYFSLGPVHALLAETVFTPHFPIDIATIQKRCSLFEGEHDFKNFCILGGRNAVTRRKVHTCSLHREELFGTEIYYIQVKAKGFLKYMVRFMVGSLLKTSTQNNIHLLSDFKEYYKAPAQGLCLHSLELFS